MVSRLRRVFVRPSWWVWIAGNGPPSTRLKRGLTEDGNWYFLAMVGSQVNC